MNAGTETLWRRGERERRALRFFAYAMDGAIKRAEDKGDEGWYKDTSNAVQIGEWLSQSMVFLLEVMNTGREGR